MKITNQHIELWREAEKEVDNVLGILSAHYGAIRDEEYFIVLFFLLLRKDGLDDATVHLNHNDLKVFMGEMFELKMNELKIAPTRRKYWDSIFVEAYRVVDKIFNDKVPVIIQTIKAIDQRVFDEDFKGFFDHVLYKIASSKGVDTRNYVLPKEVSKFVMTLADVKDSDIVYNPFAGVGSFGVFRKSNSKYIGQEANGTTYLVGLMRLLAHQDEDENLFFKGDSVMDWQDYKYNCIVASPPFNQKMDFSHEGRFGSPNFVDQFLIEKGINSLSDNGRMVVVMSNRFLFSQGLEKSLKEFLIAEDLIETVISMPPGLLFGTGVAFSIVVLNKNKKKKESDAILFVDASKYSYKENNIFVLSDEIYGLLSNDNETSNWDLISAESVVANEYNLTPARYLLGFQDGLIIKNFVDIEKGTFPGRNTNGKFVRIRDLSYDRNLYKLDVKTIEDIVVPVESRMISESVVLISRRGHTVESNYFEFEGTPIFISKDIMALKVDATKVNIEYFIHELHSEYIDEQYGSLLQGRTIPQISKDSLLSIKIRITSMEEQEAIARTILLSNQRIEELIDDKNLQIHETKKQQFEEDASLKHTLGAPRQNILSGASVLLKFFDSDHNSIIQVKEHFRELFSKDLTEILESIKRDANFMSELLENNENGLVLDDYPLSFISLKELGEDLKKIDGSRFKFRIDIDLDPISGDDEDGFHPLMDELGVEINKLLLRALYDNILENADKHGFEASAESNLVRMTVVPIVEKMQCHLFIMNNGKSFPQNFDKEKFIAKFSTSDAYNGTGIGGYDINRIINYLNGSWDLILNKEKWENEEFPVAFHIELPIVI